MLARAQHDEADGYPRAPDSESLTSQLALEEAHDGQSRQEYRLEQPCERQEQKLIWPGQALL